MTNQKLETEWLATFDECHSDEKEFHFEVSSQWLRELMTGWATEDSKNVESNVEAYIEGRTDSLYETLHSDIYFANNVYEIASEQGKIVNCKEVDTQ